MVTHIIALQARVKKFYELSERARDMPKDDVKVDLSAGPMLRQGMFEGGEETMYVLPCWNPVQACTSRYKWYHTHASLYKLVQVVLYPMQVIVHT
jgi:hypothetical protein